MNIIHQLSKQSLKQNKKRTLMTVLGILLSTALICAVAGMVQSGVRSLVNYEKATDGDFHVMYSNIDTSEMNYITSNAHVKQAYLSQTVGYALMPDSMNEYKPYYSIMEMMPDTLTHSAIRVTEGRLPEKPGEVIITESILYNAGVELKVGDTLTLEVGDRISESGERLTQFDPCYDVESEDPLLPEHLENLTTRSYTIVGIMQRPSYYLENFNAPGYTVIGYMDQVSSDRVNVAVTFDQASRFQEYSQSILNSLSTSDWSIFENTGLLEMEGALSYRTLNVLHTLAAIVLMIIIGTSVFVIRNSFAMSVSEKTRMYGMIASVGATSRQIRRSVLFEGFLIGLIGIPLGILCGVLAVVILIAVLNVLLKDIVNGLVFVYSIPPMTFVLTIVLASITVLLSCLIPAIRAGRIPPIEAIRGNREIRITSKKLKVSKLTRRLFGMGGVIAAKNLKRSRKKYRTTVISLVVSIAVFLSLSSFIGYGRRAVGSIKQEYGYNVAIALNDSTDGPSRIGFWEDIYGELIEAIPAEKFLYYKLLVANIPFETLNKKIRDDYQAGMDEIPETWNTEICIVPKKQFNEMAKSCEITRNVDQAVLLMDNSWYYDEDGARTSIESLSIKEGETVAFTYDKTNENGDGYTTSEFSLTLTKRLETPPMGLENVWSQNGYFFVSEANETVAGFTGDYISNLYLKAENANNAEALAMELKEDHEDWPSLSIYNVEKETSQNNRMILVIEIFLYGFITVITLIGVTNIFNTISTNMLLRRKEFAMLKSVGMTNKEFKNMIRLENILYSLKSLLIGIPLGIAGSILLYRVAIGEMDVGYVFPWTGIGISIVFVFIIVGLTMVYSLRKIEEHSLVETMRMEII